jgi:hypothetical protein
MIWSIQLNPLLHRHKPQIAEDSPKKTVQKWQNIPTLMGIQLNHAKLHLKTQKSAGSNAKKGQTSPATS